MDDVVVGGKFKIGMKIGSGSYGVIHEGVNIESGEKVAIKLEPANTEYPLLEHESDIYKHLDGGPGIPKLKWFGVEGEHNIMVIDLLGQSLADLMASSGPLDMKTVLILAVQLILTLEYIHSRGVIHRDIKPDNLLMGLGSNAHQVYLVDFGLAGYYIDPSSDEHIEYRESNGFVGTYRYASMFSHYGIEQSRRDDLHSLGYVLLYLLGGSLPWQGLSAERDQEELHRLYYEKKSEILVQELCKSCPRGFKRYFLVCRNLSFYEEPAYRLFRRNFLDDFEDLGFKSDYIYYMPDALKNKNRNRIGAGNMEIDGVDSISRLLKNKMLYLVPDPPEYVPDPPENRNRIGAGNKETNRENCISCVKNKNIYYMPTALKNRNRIASPSPSPAPSAVAQQPPLQQSPVQAQPTPVQPAQQQVAAPPPSQKTVPVARNGFGTMGNKCVIRANHFLVNFGDKDPHQYDVTITPEVISKRKSREILQLLINLYKQSHLGNMLLAYDGKKSAFAAGPLPFESKEFVVKLTESNGREKEFKVNIKFAARKDLYHLRQFLAGRQHDNPQETIQALDVVLREAASTGREILGRSLLSTQFGSGVLGDGIEYWKGFYQSLRPTQMGLSLNIDMSARAFYEPKLVTDFVSDFLMKDLMRPLSDQERIKVKRILRGVRVEVRRPDYMRRYKVQALTVQPTNQLTFPVDETGATISVVQYFREKYNINLRYPHLPAIQAGSDSKPTYLPMEICTIVKGQRYAMKLNEKQVTNLLRATCQRPRDREENIVNTMRSNQYNQNQLVNKDFGMNVLEQLTSIDARVLPPPPLKYHDSGANSVVYPSGGQWNMINLKMINGGTVNYWAIANFSRHREDAVGRFVHGLVSMCQNKGMVFNPQPLIPMSHSAPNNIEKALVDIHTRSSNQLKQGAPPGSSLQLLFVILPDAKGTYPRIKRVCETELGIVSQCCKPNHVMKMSPQYFENVALKINVKVGGRNTVLVAALANMLPYITVRPTIIFGADVTHPSPGEDSRPSIAAVVASMDWPQVTKYKALVSAQPHRQEIIEDLYSTTTDSKRGVVHTGLIRELLISFKKSTGHKPHRIIFYRDGVSEGQFSEVLMSEMDKIRKACVSLEENYLPPVTFIVVQKRHHTRFFPMKHGDKASTDRSGNILPGTVVDTKICHPTEFDFYLCSHAGIKGTSRPTHYHVLYDENKFTADGLQFLTYQLCYTYQRCTRSVSIVPPAYYAHLAAFRARYYMEGDLSDSASSHDGGGPRATRDRVADVRPVPVIHENVKSVMFYC